MFLVHDKSLSFMNNVIIFDKLKCDIIFLKKLRLIY